MLEPNRRACSHKLEVSPPPFAVMAMSSRTYAVAHIMPSALSHQIMVYSDRASICYKTGEISPRLVMCFAGADVAFDFAVI